MNIPLLLSALGELMTGLALLIEPALVGKLLLGEELTGVAIPVARVLGLALIGLGIACWPKQGALRGMIFYNVGISVYLSYVGITSTAGGVLLWPAVIAHTIMSALLVRNLFVAKKTP